MGGILLIQCFEEYQRKTNRGELTGSLGNNTWIPCICAGTNQPGCVSFSALIQYPRVRSKDDRSPVGQESSPKGNETCFLRYYILVYNHLCQKASRFQKASHKKVYKSHCLGRSSTQQACSPVATCRNSKVSGSTRSHHQWEVSGIMLRCDSTRKSLERHSQGHHYSCFVTQIQRQMVHLLCHANIQARPLKSPRLHCLICSFSGCFSRPLPGILPLCQSLCEPKLNVT